MIKKYITNIFLISALFVISFIKISAQNRKTDFKPNPHRFDIEINRFVNQDLKNSFPNDAILFVGSSSIRMWKTHKSFPEYKVVNRGFGGSHISDVIYFIDKVALKYSPKLIIFYAGDNDIFDKKSPEHVLNDYKNFVKLVLDSLPRTEIDFLTIKPSINRWKFWKQMKKANDLIADYSKSNSLLSVIDISDGMLNKSGMPKKEIFRNDGLHLNDTGYKLWTDKIKLFLQKDILSGMVKFDEVYIPVLALTSQNKIDLSLIAMERLKKYWTEFKNMYSNYYFNDKNWGASFCRIDNLISRASTIVDSREKLRQAHETLEGVRQIFMKLRHRNNINYFIDLLTEFHEPMEKIVLKAKKLKPEKFTKKDWREFNGLSITAKRLWKNVMNYNFNSSLFNFDRAKTIKFRNNLSAESKMLNKLLNSMNNKNINAILQNAKNIKPNFAKIFMMFGD
ncbi:GDSL-like Lipase/Acylhydrolase [bacterium BMS3Abin04]|nr:GDSL-like Lipase/Acylhydrolase [bacterium BMS3Abin04]